MRQTTALTRIGKALALPVRERMLWMLADRERCGCESRISVWAWRNNQYLPRGSHMMGLMSYCEKQKRKKSA